MPAWHWWLAILGLGCVVTLAWSVYHMMRPPFGFDAAAGAVLDGNLPDDIASSGPSRAIAAT